MSAILTHNFFGAGDPSCPKEDKAPNGELHSLRCKVCGAVNPRDPICAAAKPDRPYQPWERNFSGGRIGVQEQQGTDENWIILHVESGGVKTTTSLRHHEAWVLAQMVSPQLKAEFDRRLTELRKSMDALHSLTYRGADVDLIRSIADDRDCGSYCEHAFGGFGLSGCHLSSNGECAADDAESLRALATALETARNDTEADVLRAIDSCGGAPDPTENADWSRGYDAALEAAEAEVRRMFAKAGAA